LGTKKAKGRIAKYFVFAFWIIFVILGPLLAGGFLNGVNTFFPNEQGTTLFSFSENFNGEQIFTSESNQFLRLYLDYGLEIAPSVVTAVLWPFWGLLELRLRIH
jgi:hypothetical protein